MNKIEVKVLNPHAVKEAEQMMVAAARLTQRGHKIESMKDFEALLDKPYRASTVESMCDLPHPTIQKFGIINVAVVGASRRFLAQITRHQNDVKFMSASLQYSNYTGKAQFCVPYEILEAEENGTHVDYAPLNNLHETARSAYLNSCERQLRAYEALAMIVGRDAAGYAMPQGLRNVLLISALPFQWVHMIRQRTCNRNTKETQYTMLRIWEELYPLSPMFGNNCGAPCVQKATAFKCPEGNMCCGNKLPPYATPAEILNTKFPLLRR
jgi:thymidylate synthase (FAD)